MHTQVRLACILAPNLSIQVEYQRRGDRAPLIIPNPLNGETVFAASSSLLLAGVEIGMSLHQARQIAPYAIIAETDEAEYHERHEAMRGAVKVFSSAVETIGLGEF